MTPEAILAKYDHPFTCAKKLAREGYGVEDVQRYMGERLPADMCRKIVLYMQDPESEAAE